MMQDNYTHTTAVISVVDDDESVRTSLESLLRSNGYQVRIYADALAFLQSSGPNDTHCLISDIQMPGMCGVQMYETLTAMGFDIPIIFITAYPGALPKPGAGARGLIAYLPKPFPADTLMACVETALNRRA
ncbi:response regulator [Pseudomonas sp. CrR25]|nr:response regulator [Pseudomonas sp. CrR25]